MKEGQDELQKKKVNKLKLSEAYEMKKFLERCDQQNSMKYKHVLGRITLLEGQNANV